VRPERWQANTGQWDRLKPNARRLRQNQTAAEAKLWKALRKSQVAGLKFRRQHALDRYIVDFYCHEKRLSIEVDGPIHCATEQEDAIRGQIIESRGITVLRFKNEEVFDDLPSVLERITKAAEVNPQSTSSPSPSTGRGPGGGV